eukprot:Opistho-2@21565
MHASRMCVRLVAPGGCVFPRATFGRSAGRLSPLLTFVSNASASPFASGRRLLPCSPTIAVGRGSRLTHSIADATKGVDNLAHKTIDRLHEIDNKFKFRGYSTLKIGSAFVGAAVLYIYIFKEDIKDNLSTEVADVASRSLGDESVVQRAEEVSKAVLQQVIRDPSTLANASSFVVQISQEPTTQAALVALLKGVLADPEAMARVNEFLQHIVADLLKDTATMGRTVEFVQSLMAQEGTKESLSTLFRWLLTDPSFQHTATLLLKDVIASKEIVDQTAVLAIQVTHTVLDDTDVQDHAQQFIGHVLTDEAIHKHGGDAIWEAIKYSVTPTWLGGDPKSQMPTTSHDILPPNAKVMSE